MADSEETPLDGVAIIGMAGRFPGARSVDELWHNLCAGIESITFFTPEELTAAGVEPAIFNQPNYVPARGALGDAEYFDAAFFGHSPNVAALMDPQHRLFLECAWTALEHAGYDSERYQGRIGVFGGESMNTYLLNNVFSHMRMVASVDSLQASIGNDKDSLTTEVAYKLNLTGPSITVQTASSTSLAAVHVACQSLLNYECDMSLAGGVSIHFPETAGYLYQEGGATSPDGHCRAFDASSKGFVNGHGAGVVVLKRLEHALEDRDTIYAVIRGSAINNDGAVKVSYMAPSVDGQAAVITMAQTLAGVSPATISYVEAHGTGTNLGDPIEIAALTQAFRAGSERRGYCAIGSLKTNIGHLDAAAGVAGLIKAALALTHERIPPSLHYTRPNPQIDFASSPFYVNTSLAEWPRTGTPRRAGVSSFGMGGTNAHAVLEEAPLAEPADPAQPWQLITLAARSASALDQQTANLAAYLHANPQANLADVAYTLYAGRRAFNHRRTLVCRDAADAAQALAANDPERLLSSYQEPGERPLVLLFAGQGAQYAGMAAGLYETEAVFREIIDRCATLLLPELGLDLRGVVFGETKDGGLRTEDGGRRIEDGESSTVYRLPSTVSQAPSTINGHALDQTALTQPALFVVEYALAQLYSSWGLKPSAMLGHSIGEYVAACLAGVFSLEDALRLVVARGRLMQALPAGAMLVVPLPEAEVLPLLGSQLSLAAVNGPALCVVSGPTEAVDTLERQLGAHGLNCRKLHTSHAFHSAMMEPVLAPFTELVRGIKLNPPQLPYISNVSGTWVTAEQATNPAYWAQHLRQAVRFADGLGELLRDPQAVLLELGPGQTLATLARQHPAKTTSHVVLNTLRHPNDSQPDRAFLLATLARLWLAGVAPEAAQLFAGQARRRIALPTYPFERQRFWLEPLRVAYAPQAAPLAKHSDMAEWFYLPFWKPALPPAPATSEPTTWLLFADTSGLSAQLAQQLGQAAHQVVVVHPGHSFAQIDERLYRLNPTARADYERLLSDLHTRGLLPTRVVHAWGVTPAEAPADLVTTQQHGFYSLLALTQALGAQHGLPSVHLLVLTNGMQQVGAEPLAAPAKAGILGLCKVIPQEYPSISCQTIDITIGGYEREPQRAQSTPSDDTPVLAAPLIAVRPSASRVVSLPNGKAVSVAAVANTILTECLAPTPGAVLAYRAGRRWQQAFEPVRLEASTHQIRERGVYLITGGFGGVGLALARRLAITAQARLALLARTPLPPRSAWDAINDDQARRRIAAVRELEALGAEVLVLAADVARPTEVRAALDATLGQFGELHGVIHAAGLVGKHHFQVIQEADQAACERHFQAKIHGTIALQQALAGQQLDFCMLTSSLSAVLGGLGFAAYAAANSTMDALAQQYSQQGVPWISVDWDAWELTEQQRQSVSAAEAAGEFALSAAEGGEAFERILAAGAPLVVVSTGDLQARLSRWVELAPTTEATQAEAAMPGNAYPRPNLPNPYIAPRNETEQAIAELWQATLGVAQVGIHDNFFDLGGNSLSGIKVIGRIKERFDIQIPTVSLYEGPTVSALAKLIAQDGDDQPSYEQSRSRGERRREKRRAGRGSGGDGA